MGCSNVVQLAQLRQLMKSYDSLPSRDRAAAAKELGNFGEHMAEMYLHHLLDHDVVFDGQAAAAHHGIDLVTASGTQLVAVEVKSTAQPAKGKPTMSRTSDGKQGTGGHIGARGDRANIDAVTAEDVESGTVASIAVGVNITTGVLEVYDVNPDGSIEPTPTSGVGLDDLAAYCDAVTPPDRG